MEGNTIQFQAWDKKFKCMLKWEDIMAIVAGEKRAFYDFENVPEYKLNGTYANGQRNYSHAGTTQQMVTQKIYEGNIFNDPDLIFLRGVGRNDKNGGQLFEGDIILLEDPIDAGYYEVVYDLKRSVFLLERRKTKTRELYFWNLGSTQITKVGNIFEDNDKFLNKK